MDERAQVGKFYRQKQSEMNATSSSVVIIGPISCQKVTRKQTYAGSITLQVGIDRASQARIEKYPSITHVVVNGVVFRMFRSARGDLLYLRTPPPTDESEPPYIPMPIQGLITAPHIRDVASIRAPALLYMLAVIDAP